MVSLSSFVIEELEYVVARKFPAKAQAVDALLSGMSYELVYTPKEMRRDLFAIRDGNDYPVLYTAIVEDVDILLTGDKDFDDVEIERPAILTPSEFIDRYT